MDVLGRSYLAVVVGVSGCLGKAPVEHLRSDPNCGPVAGPSRNSEPRIDIMDELRVAGAAAWLRERSAEWDLIFDATGVLTIEGHRPEKRLREFDPALMARAFAVNAIGPALLLNHLTPLLPRRRRAIFASLSARVVHSGQSAWRLGELPGVQGCPESDPSHSRTGGSLEPSAIRSSGPAARHRCNPTVGTVSQSSTGSSDS